VSDIYLLAVVGILAVFGLGLAVLALCCATWPAFDESNREKK